MMLRVRHPGRQPADIPLGPARGRMAGTSFYLIGDVALVPNRALSRKEPAEGRIPPPSMVDRVFENLDNGGVQAPITEVRR